MSAEEPRYAPLAEEEKEQPEEEQAEGDPDAEAGSALVSQATTNPAFKRSNAGKLTYFWIVDPHAWWRHPVARIFVPFFIMAIDFYVYAEDPVNDSRVEYNFPVLGHWYGLLVLWPSEVSLICLRVVIILLCVGLGVYVGRHWIHHRWLRDRLKMTMFRENNGTLIIEVFAIFVFLYFGAVAYNFMLGGSMNSPISSNTGMEFYKWGKVFQIFSVFLDIVSIVMITDQVLQDKTHYPKWAAPVKRVWMESCGGWVRVITAWVSFIGMMTATVVVVLMCGHGEGAIVWKDTIFIGGLSEVWRTHLLSLCVFCDLLCVAQDWEFPSFRTGVDVKVAGTFSEEFSFIGVSQLVSWLLWPFPECGCCSCSWCSFSREDLIESFRFRMSGPWMTYLPLFLAVIFGDLTCGKNQFTYKPENYGQYVDPETNRIWCILDKEYLKKAYTEGVLTMPELITYAARRDTNGDALDDSAKTDVLLNSRYEHRSIFLEIGSVTDTELSAFLVGFVLAISFTCLVAGGERAWKSRAAQLLSKVAS